MYYKLKVKESQSQIKSKMADFNGCDAKKLLLSRFFSENCNISFFYNFENGESLIYPVSVV